MGKKRKRVPNVLWTLFNHNARTLSATIVSLIPKLCDCYSSGRCVRCIFGNSDDNALSYLVRPDDPPDYRRFMNNCFVVLPDGVSSLPPLLSFTHYYSQLQLVQGTIQVCFMKQAVPSNVMLHGYGRFQQLSSIVKLLTQSVWDLVLKRIGDSFMVYLLQHTLIFMPVKHNLHQQVTGPPINRFGLPPVQPSSSSTDTRNSRKRGRPNGKDSITEEPPCKVSVQAVKFQQNSCHSVGNGNEGNDDRSCSEPSTLSQLIEACNSSGDFGSFKMEIHEGKPIEILENKLRKRFRQPSWQRRKRCKKTVLEGSPTTVPSAEILSVKDDLNKTREHDLTSDQWSGKVGPTSNKTCCNKQVDILLLCPCCSVFRSLSSLPMDAQINRKPIFYNMKHSPSLFLENHILNSLKPGSAGIKKLLQDIFGLAITDTKNLPTLCFHKKGFCSNASSCLYHSFVKSLKIFMWRAKKCQHVQLLQKHCIPQVNLLSDTEDIGSTLQGSKPSPKQETIQKVGKLRDCRRTPEVIQRQFGLTQPYCLKDEVVSFVWAVCRSILPPELLGSSSNCRILRRNISKFIKLRRFEKFSLGQCIYKLELSKFPLLSSTESSKETHGQKPRLAQNIAYKCNTLKRALLERWIFWLFTCIIVPLVQAKFYVTESEHGKLNIYYYRKSTWEKLSDKITKSLKDKSYRYLDNASVAEILRKRTFGFSKVRLCPKEAGARPIANLKTPSRFCMGRSSSLNRLSGKCRNGRAPNGNNRATYFKSVNTVLRDLHLVIKDVKRKEPERWGSTVFCYNDIHRKFCLFLRHLKQGQAAMPVVYLVVSDVQKAFDTIKQDKLLSILNEMEMPDKYRIQKSNEIFCRKKRVWSSEGGKLMSQTDGSGSSEMISSAHRRSFHTVSVNQEQSRTIRREDLLLILKEHLKNNVLKLDRNFFLQTVGIPQGSVLSTLLCTLYYGHLENSVLVPHLARAANHVAEHSDNGRVALEVTPDAFFPLPKSMLLRFVDDYLFISTSKEEAVTFFSRLCRGFHAYNCYMNREKFCTNFDDNSLQHGSKRMLVGSDGVCFLQWSGLLINSCNLEVQGDYSRYLNDHLSSTITVNWERHPSRKLKMKLCAYMRPKCHPIFFDATINSPATIKLNVYQAFLLCAMKFHCYVRELSTWCNLHPKTYLTSIEGSLRYMQKLMKRRMVKAKSTVLMVSKQEIQWLGLTAYVRVLNRKKSRHKELLSLLKPKLKPFSRIGGSPELRYAVDDSHSSLLWKIKY